MALTQKWWDALKMCFWKSMIIQRMALNRRFSGKARAMIKIDAITIEEFRGIRNLTLDLRGKNFSICGPNGTGKSGVVDALEFVLTGNISRLSGEGRGEITLKQHAPHVDKRDDPSKARVIVKITIPHLNKSATIERDAKDPTLFKLTPNTPEILEVVQQVAQHPEIMLSRRELIRYVLATPGKRNEEVQALLHLERIGEVRANLFTIANGIKKQLVPSEGSVKSAVANLNRALDISLMNKENILSAANAKRAILHLPELVELTSTTSLKDGMATPGPAKPQAIPKKQAAADIEAAQEVLQELTGATTKESAVAVLVYLKALAADPLAAASISRESFYKMGIALVEDESCPFCETEWDMEILRAKIQAKLDRFKELALKRREVEKKIQPIAALLRKTQGILNPLLRHAAVAKPAIEMQTVEDFTISCQTASQTLSNLHSLPDAIAVLENLTSGQCGVHAGASRLKTSEYLQNRGQILDARKFFRLRHCGQPRRNCGQVWRRA